MNNDMRDDDELQTVKEVAARLRIHPMTVYRLIEDGILPALRFRGAYRIYTSAVDAYLQASVYRPTTRDV